MNKMNSDSSSSELIKLAETQIDKAFKGFDMVETVKNRLVQLYLAGVSSGIEMARNIYKYDEKD